MRIGLMFAGQGAQYPGMGKDLWAEYASAKKLFSQADELLQWPLSNLCFNGDMESLTSCANCQPAIYTVSMLCWQVFQERFPIVPQMAAGLSLGEYAALTAAGTIDFATGLRLVAKRGELMDESCQLTDGGMCAVLGADVAVLQPICQRLDLDIANLNCPGQIIISGKQARVLAAAAELQSAGFKAMPLPVAGAYHSRLMQSAADKFATVLAEAQLQTPQLPVAQNICGTIVTTPAEIRRNLVTQISGSVRWEDCVRTLLTGCDLLLEFGPGTVLAGLLRRIDRAVPTFSINSCETLDKAITALEKM